MVAELSDYPKCFVETHGISLLLGQASLATRPWEDPLFRTRGGLGFWVSFVAKFLGTLKVVYVLDLARELGRRRADSQVRVSSIWGNSDP